MLQTLDRMDTMDTIARSTLLNCTRGYVLPLSPRTWRTYPGILQTLDRMDTMDTIAGKHPPMV
jgi:hypothetical protein